jgi:hypothetical protein
LGIINRQDILVTLQDLVGVNELSLRIAGFPLSISAGLFQFIKNMNLGKGHPL